MFFIIENIRSYFLYVLCVIVGKLVRLDFYQTQNSNQQSDVKYTHLISLIPTNCYIYIYERIEIPSSSCLHNLNSTYFN